MEEADEGSQTYLVKQNYCETNTGHLFKNS